MHAIPKRDGFTVVPDNDMEQAALELWSISGAKATIAPDPDVKPVGACRQGFRVAFAAPKPKPSPSPRAFRVGDRVLCGPMKYRGTVHSISAAGRVTVNFGGTHIEFPAAAVSPDPDPPPTPMPEPWKFEVGDWVRIRESQSVAMVHGRRRDVEGTQTQRYLVVTAAPKPAMPYDLTADQLDPWEPKPGEDVARKDTGAKGRVLYTTPYRMACVHWGGHADKFLFEQLEPVA